MQIISNLPFIKWFECGCVIVMRLRRLMGGRGLVRVVVRVSLRRVLMPREAVAGGRRSATVTERIRYTGQLHIGRSLRRSVCLYIGEHCWVRTRVLSAILSRRESSIATVCRVNGASARSRSRQSEPIRTPINVPRSFWVPVPVPMLWPWLRSWWRGLACCRIS